MTIAYINRIASVVPSHDVHERFVDFARVLLGAHEQRSVRFERMVEVSGIAHRYSCIDPDDRHLLHRILHARLDLHALRSGGQP